MNGKVMYQPCKQDTAMIDRGMRNWEPVGAMLLLGTAFTTLGFVSLRVRSGSATHSKPTLRLNQHRAGGSGEDNRMH
jgi:hypothetical protein